MHDSSRYMHTHAELVSWLYGAAVMGREGN